MLLNHSIDRVSYDTRWNINTIIRYFEGKRNYLSFPDTNPNVKNSHYQLVGVSCAAIIDFYCFDPRILKMTVVAKDPNQVEYSASNTVVLCIASPSTKKMASLGTSDIGNFTVTVISIVFMKL